MIGGAKTLTPGDLFQTKTGEFYIYLGYYSGRAESTCDRPDAGYLYLRYNPLYLLRFKKPGPENIKSNDVISRIQKKATQPMDGNVCYTKEPKQFTRHITNVNLNIIMPQIQTLFGLQRLGDKKPHKNNQKQEE